MAVGETIALVGLDSRNTSSFVRKLVNHDYRLLIIPSGKEEKMAFGHQFENNSTIAEVEVLDCAKDGCWEADIIAFLHPLDLEEGMLNRIKEVAVQKIILYVTEGKIPKVEDKTENLQRLFPHSRIVQVKGEAQKGKVSLSGKDHEAVQYITEVLQKADFTFG